MAAVTTVYPWADQHVVTGPDDVDVTPARLHPAFHGSFDWHSCVHMLASGVSLLTLAPDALAPATRTDLEALLDARLLPGNTAVEAALIRRRPGFERPYGWAWALRLAAVTGGTRWGARSARMRAAADAQVTAVAGHVSGGDFRATHWLVTYALAAELSGGRPAGP